MTSQAKPSDAVRQAREILERWQSSDLFERISSTGPIASSIPSDRPPLASTYPVSKPLLSETPPVAAQPAVAATQVNIWESLLAPSPMLATSAPAIDDEEVTAADLAIPVLVAGVEEVRIRALSNRPLTEPGVLNVSSEDSAGTIPVLNELFPAETPPSADLAPSAASVPMSTMLVHADSANADGEPADSANEPQSAELAESKKNQRNPLRRPPLHRRFQLERPVSASPSGSDAVTRKLRLDQPGGSEEISEVTPPAASLASSVAPDTRIVSNSPKPGKRFRVDSAESVSEVTGTDGRRGRTHGLPKKRYIDESTESLLRGPHFEVNAPRRSNLTSVTGQFLAYLGVLGLTIGTSIVIYGHFGGYSDYTPTGWLVTTVAQMLLFLGVINLVSGGIEQNNDDVSRRINTLGEQLLRIEQVTSEALRGPKISPRKYDDPDAASEESQRETAMSERE